MTSPAENRSPEKPLRQILILADESAHWIVAGLRQLDRLLCCLEEFAATEEGALNICLLWHPAMRPNEHWIPDRARFLRLNLSEREPAEPSDLVLSTRLFLYRDSVPQLRAALSASMSDRGWDSRFAHFAQEIATGAGTQTEPPWQYLASPKDIRACARRFLVQSGKSQDGLVSRYLNRPISRALSHWLLKLPLLPTTWSLSIFVLPLLASVFFLQGTAAGFIIGCAIFQLYSILDGCDGEIARAKFQQSESGRRLDSLCDLLGNLLLALSLGIGLARQAARSDGNVWLFVSEGVVAAGLILLSEGIVFLRRARPETEPTPTKWNSALYQRHHEFFERSGILLLGEKVAWWIVQLTKRDMAMLGFLALACLGWTAWILHLHVLVSGISSALAANAFLRPAPVILSEEAS